MNKTTISLSLLGGALVISLAGCSTSPVTSVTNTQTNSTIQNNSNSGVNEVGTDITESDFQPTEGKLDIPGEDPADKRLMLATSTDGLHFTRTNQIIADQANVPNLIQTDDGTIYLYYSGWTVGEEENVSAVAISQDNGSTWVHKYLVVDEQHSSRAGDPDVELLDNGTFRLFYTGQADGTPIPQIYYADSDNGVEFITGGSAFVGSDDMAIDSSTFRIGDTWHQFALKGMTLDHYHATSQSGTDFELSNIEQFTYNNKPYVLANEIPTADGVRFYAFTLKEPFITFLSTNGEDWEVEATDVLTLDTTAGLESEYIKDPAVVQLQDGTYLMAYVTVIP